MNLQNSILIIFITGSVLAGCQSSNNFNKAAETEAITKAIHSSIGWIMDKDLNLLYGIIANDSSFIEVHPDSSIAFGFEQFKEAEKFWMDPRFKAVGYEITNLKITISNSGDVAWFFCMLDDMNDWDGRPVNWMNTRWTGVLEKREGKWRTVQQHFSFAANE